MKALSTTSVAAAALLAGIGTAGAQTDPAQNPPTQTTAGKRIHRWWNDPPGGRQQYLVNAKKMPLISIKGTHFEGPQAAGPPGPRQDNRV